MARGQGSVIGLVTGLAALATLAALVAFAALWSLFWSDQGPYEPGDERWAMIGGGVLIVPYVLVVWGSRLGTAVARGLVFLAIALVTIVWALPFYMVPLLFAVPLFIAAARALREKGKPTGGFPGMVLVALGGAALLSAALFGLYARQDERCWQTIRYADGQEERQAVEAPAGAVVVHSYGGTVETPRGSATEVGGGCTSDVVTTRDAAAGLALAAAGAMTLLSLPWPGEEQRGFWLLTLGSLSIAALSALLIGNPLYALGAPIVLLGALLVGVPRAIKVGVQAP